MKIPPEQFSKKKKRKKCSSQLKISQACFECEGDGLTTF
jgi:hypothetical protein